MIVQHEGKRLRLDGAAVLGSGGEATVFALDASTVAKVYHQPTPAHARKLTALLGRKLPAAVAAPRALLHAEKGKEVVGCVLPRVPDTFSPFATLLKRSARGPREHGGASIADIVALLCRLSAIVSDLHASGVVVGDLSDQNELWAGTDVALIDADSFQLDGEPCTVGTEAYLDPLLYDVDLAAGPRFSAANDAYALSVLAFRALLSAHPYGGTHATLASLPARARARVWALSPDVRYPHKVALPPQALSDELLAHFERVFVGGERPGLPTDALLRHAASVDRCAACGTEAPRARASCPACATARPRLAPVQRGLSATRLLEARGPVLAMSVFGAAIHVFCQEDGDTVWYVLGPGGPRRNVLGRHAPRAVQLALANGMAARAVGDDVTLHAADGELVTTTTTESFDGLPVLAAAGGDLLRIAAGTVLSASLRVTGRHASLIERPVAAALRGQTGIAAATPDGRHVFGLDRLFRHVSLFRLDDGERRDLPLPRLGDAEALDGVSVVPDGAAAAVLRATHEAGVPYVRVDLVDARGHLACSSRLPAGTRERGSIDGRAFKGTTLLHPTDEGLLRERLAHGGVGPVDLVPGTDAWVSSASRIATHPDGLVVTDGASVVLLSLRLAHPRCLASSIPHRRPPCPSPPCPFPATTTPTASGRSMRPTSPRRRRPAPVPGSRPRRATIGRSRWSSSTRRSTSSTRRPSARWPCQARSPTPAARSSSSIATRAS